MELFNKQQVEMMEFLSRGLPPQSKWRYNPVTDRIDIDGDFICEWTGFKDFKGVKFGRISGNFSCSGLGLTSLIGSPESIGKSFNCSKNNLTSLEGSPKTIGYNFDCSGNNLTSLEGSPKIIGGSFNCSKNSLVSLEGGPEDINGDYNCSSNKLVTLKGSPKSFHGHSFWREFNCWNNLLKNLEGFDSPKFQGRINCGRNHITSLEGAPTGIKPYSNYNLSSYEKLEGKISYHGNKGISGKLLQLIHITMIQKKAPFIIALGMLKDQIKESDLKKLIQGCDDVNVVIKGASMMGRFLNP